MGANHGQPGENSRIASVCICCRGAAINRSPAVLMPFVASRVFGWEPVEITPSWGLRDIKRGFAYSLCCSLQCADCGVLFLDIRFNEAEMAALYTGYRGDSYTKLRNRFEPGYLERNQLYLEGSSYIPEVEKLLLPYLGPLPRVLDWGGDTGVNTPFRNRNSLLHIYDISEKSVVEGATRVDKATIKTTDYDLIVIVSVLEHVPFPIDTLSEIAATMGPNTLLYVEIPHEELMRANPGSTELYRTRKHWHEHINFFSEKSLGPLLSASGLASIHVQELEVIAGGGTAHMFSVICRRV